MEWFEAFRSHAVALPVIAPTLAALIGLGVGITAWLYGIATAGRDVQHWNQAHGIRFVRAPGRFGIAVPVP